jgi:hypothetical protein
MKKWAFLIAVILVAIFLSALWLSQPGVATRSTFSLSGKEGLSFKALITADGVEVTFLGKLPMELQVAGHSVDCSFQKAEPDGRIALDVVFADGTTAAAVTSGPQGGVRAQFYKKLFVNKSVTTAF